jgi:hypothetical protein
LKRISARAFEWRSIIFTWRFFFPQLFSHRRGCCARTGEQASRQRLPTRDRAVYGRPVKAAKTHSPLFRSVATNLLSRNPELVADIKVTQAIKSHKTELKKERKAKKKVRLDAEHNIHIARKREPKTLRQQQTISRSFSNSKPIRHIGHKQTPTTADGDRELLTEVVNDSASVTFSTNTMASTAKISVGPNDDYKENDQMSHIMICPDCKEFPPNLTEEFSSGDMVCATCGLVVSRFSGLTLHWY